MRSNKTLIFIILVLGSTAFLLPNFYSNKWSAVESTFYEEWQIRYDRLVVARLARNQQVGLFSDGGFLGLGDAAKWNFFSSTHRHQYDVYYEGGSFETYLAYKSNPGFQGILYGALDKLLNLPGEQKVEVFRGFTALLSALTFGLIFAATVMEFGVLAGIITLIFSVISIWTVLPAGSIFWNLWAFFLPFTTSSYLIFDAVKRDVYNARKINIFLFIATLVRILLSGFDFITTGLIMTTAPIIFYGISEKWEIKTFLNRLVQVGISISVATLTGLVILSAQIITHDGNITSAISYVENRFGHHAAGNSDFFFDERIEATKIGVFEIIGKYIAMPAINVRLPGPDIQILYWHIIVLFAAFTAVYFLVHKKQEERQKKAIALIATTWYSLLAPLSWIALFRPHSIIHTHVNTMAWQMPFTLLGFALCGYVITDLFRRQTY